MINEILYKKLIEVASQGKTISYKEVMALVGLKLGNHGQREIGKMLGEISEAEDKNGNPLLSVVVVTAMKNKPGDGFFELSRVKNLNLRTDEDKDEFFRAELERVHKHWQAKEVAVASPQYWLENYWPIESERTSLTVWFHKKKKLARAKMRVGDHVIFYETRKNPDGYEGGAKTIFALGILTDKFLSIPEGHENRGGKEWEIRQAVTPVILIQPKDGVPLKEIEKRLPQCRGWVRQGTQLSRENFEILESMLKEKAVELEQEEISKDLSYQEGAERRVIQTARERNPKLRQDAVDKYGKLCMVCGLSFDEFYGQDISDGYIEVHHEYPLSESSGKRETLLVDVKVVCSNCHRMIHHNKKMMDWRELKKRIEQRRIGK